MLILPIYFGTCYTAENENDYNDFNNFPNLTVAVLSHVGGKKLYFSLIPIVQNLIRLQFFAILEQSNVYVWN